MKNLISFTAILLIANVTYNAGTFINQIYIARFLGQSEFGDYNYVLSLLSPLAIIIGGSARLHVNGVDSLTSRGAYDVWKSLSVLAYLIVTFCIVIIFELNLTFTVIILSIKLMDVLLDTSIAFGIRNRSVQTLITLLITRGFVLASAGGLFWLIDADTFLRNLVLVFVGMLTITLFYHIRNLSRVKAILFSDLSTLTTSMITLSLATFVDSLFINVPKWFLGTHHSEIIGQFSSLMLIVFVFSFALSSLGLVNMKTYSSTSHAQLKGLLVRDNLVTLGLTSLFLLVLVFFGELLLSTIFATTFAFDRSIWLTLCFFVFFYSLGVTNSFALYALGKRRSMLRANLISVCALALLCIAFDLTLATVLCILTIIQSLRLVIIALDLRNVFSYQ